MRNAYIGPAATGQMDRRGPDPHAWPVLRILITRALLAALPFAVYFLWRAVARRGEEAEATPWGWLAAAGAALVGLSLMATVLFRPDNRGDVYVPAQAYPGGRVAPGRFDTSRHPPPASDNAPNTSP
jgi:hypothetical protein